MEIRKNKKEEMRESAGWERSNAGKNQAFSAGGDRVAALVSARCAGGAGIFGAARSRRAQTEGGAQGAGPIQCGKRNGLPHVIIKKSSDSLAAALCFGPVARNIWPHPPHP